jgi:Guanine nucleotide exchange factor synembryn
MLDHKMAAPIWQRLLSILVTADGGGEDIDSGPTTTEKDDGDCSTTVSDRLSQWNDEVEEFWRKARRNSNNGCSSTRDDDPESDSSVPILPTSDSNDVNDEHDDEILQVSSLLHQAFSHGVRRGSLSSGLWRHCHNHDDSPSQQDWNVDYSVIWYSDDWVELLRTVQNWCKWYLSRRSAFHKSTPISTAVAAAAASPLDAWNTQPMLKFYLALVEQYLLQPVAVPTSSSSSSSPPHDPHAKTMLARYASNVLFYATFGLVVVDQSRSSKVLSLLIVQEYWMPRLLRLLCFAPDDDVGLALSILRNVHVAVASVPRTSHETILHAPCNLSQDSDGADQHRTIAAAWVRTLDSSISYSVALREMAFGQAVQWATNNNEHNDPQQRCELVTEILRCGYALQMGRDLEHERWYQVTETILTWDDTNDAYYECQLAMLALLMDANAAVLCHIVSVPECQVALQRILERQVSASMSTQDTATLTPILVVLYQAAQACSTYCAILSESVFPDTDAFREAVAQQDAQRAANMTPLEPEANGSVGEEQQLRRNLVSLLTSPQSLVKRWSGELLFLLCHSQPREFVHRVGMGNALPLLASKGLVQLPC